MEVISTITYFLAYPHVRTDEKAFKYNEKTCCDDKNNSQCMPAYSVSFFTSHSSRISVLFMGEGGSYSLRKPFGFVPIMQNRSGNYIYLKP